VETRRRGVIHDSIVLMFEDGLFSASPSFVRFNSSLVLEVDESVLEKGVGCEYRGLAHARS